MRRGARVAEPIAIHGLRIATRLAERLPVEVAHHAGPVVLRDEADDRHRQAVLVTEIDPILDVGGDDPRARLRVEVVVDVAGARLVLHECQWILHLADVVVVRRHAHEQRVGPDRLRRALGQVPHHHRVVVRPRRLQEKAAEETVRRVGQLE